MFDRNLKVRVKVMKIEIWSDGEDNEEPPATPSLPPVVRLLVVFLVSWQILFQVPNAALNALVVFLWHFLRLLSHLLKNEFLTGLISFLPKTYLGLVQLLKLDSEGRFTSYVVCPGCNSIYNYESCYEMKNGKTVSKTCEFVAFPHHPHRSQRQPCGKILLKR